MAGPYYVDPAAGGADDGTSWGDAWTTLQRAIDGTDGTQPVAGDIVYCRGTETLGAAADVDGNSGSAIAGVIKFVGCNAGGSVDGTRYVMDANATAASCLSSWSAGYLYFENFELKNATGSGLDMSVGGDNNIFVNCSFNNNGAHGVDTGSGSRYNKFIRCLFYANTNSGLYKAQYHTVVFCAFYSNGDGGIASMYDQNTVVGNVFHDNGDNDPQIAIDDWNIIMNNVFDGIDQTGETGISITGENNLIQLNRITNLATGLDAANEVQFYGWNYFHDNTNDTTNSTYAYPIPLDGTSNTNQADVDADDGYNASGTDDFNLKTDRVYNGDGSDVIGLNIGS